MKIPAKFIYIIIGIIVLAAGALFKYNSQPYVSSFFPRAGQTLSQKTLDKYLKAAQKRREKNPADLQSLVDEGIVYFMQGPEYYAQSLNALNLAWQNGALDKRIFYYSGILYENLSLFDEAKKQYERFLNHQPKDYEVRMRLARLLFRMDLWEESIHYYKQLLLENPQDPTALLNCALAMQNRYEILQNQDHPNLEELATFRKETLDYYELALQSKAEMPKFKLARLYFDEGNFAKAAQSVESELQDDPKNHRLILLAAESFEKIGDNQKAYDYYNQLARIRPTRDTGQKIRELRKKLK